MCTVRITRCICQRMPFATLLPIAREKAWSVEDVMRETGCGDQCGLCRPYLREMIASGTTDFHEILWD